MPGSFESGICLAAVPSPLAHPHLSYGLIFYCWPQNHAVASALAAFRSLPETACRQLCTANSSPFHAFCLPRFPSPTSRAALAHFHARSDGDLLLTFELQPAMSHECVSLEEVASWFARSSLFPSSPHSREAASTSKRTHSRARRLCEGPSYAPRPAEQGHGKGLSFAALLCASRIPIRAGRA